MIREGATWRSARGEFLDLGVSVSAHCPSQPAIPPPAHRGQVLERKSCGRSAILGKKLQFLVQTPLSKNSCLIAAQLRQKAFSSESFSHYWVEKCPVGQGGWRMWDWNSRWMVLKVKSPLLTLCTVHFWEYASGLPQEKTWALASIYWNSKEPFDKSRIQTRTQPPRISLINRSCSAPH